MMKKEFGIFMLLVVLCITVSILNHRFLLPNNLANNAQLIGMNGIFSIGLGMVIITGGIDLSVGSMFALLAIILATLINDRGWSWPIGVLVMFAVAVGIGTLHGWLIAKVRLQAFIVTLCGLLVYRGLARALAHDSSKGFTAENAGLLKTIATKGYGVPISFIAFILIAIIMAIVLHRSVYGRYLFAVGRNELAARYSGINSRLIIGSAYAISGLLAGISTIFIAFYAESIQASQLGSGFELYGIAAAVLGGCSLRGGEGSILGIVLGTAVIQVLRNMIILLNFPTEYNDTVIGVVIFVGVLADQIFSERRRRKLVQPAAAPPTGFAVVVPSQGGGKSVG